MPISPKCEKCKEILNDFGALLLSPPNIKDRVRKMHVCKKCYKQLLKDIQV